MVGYISTRSKIGNTLSRVSGIYRDEESLSDFDMHLFASVMGFANPRMSANREIYQTTPSTQIIYKTIQLRS